MMRRAPRSRDPEAAVSATDAEPNGGQQAPSAAERAAILGVFERSTAVRMFFFSLRLERQLHRRQRGQSP
jgi:hypothetical protein